MESRGSLYAHKDPPQDPILSQFNLVHAPTSCLFMVLLIIY
jgi:hypothetical protein